MEDAVLKTGHDNPTIKRMWISSRKHGKDHSVRIDRRITSRETVHDIMRLWRGHTLLRQFRRELLHRWSIQESSKGRAICRY
ncbi:hypothetical protein TNCV_3933991 [Trichonephila clavipes]|nr:hypothetical protein TNCV_3933991 [Trichonephila clavipes]